MLVAYLRGLLQPSYDNGIRSVVRENLILQALSLELEADELLSRTQMEAAYAPLMKGTNANNLLKHHDKMLSLAYSAKRHESQKKNDLKNIDVHSIDKFIETYRLIKQQGLLEIKT